jgi:hypothetical protein
MRLKGRMSHRELLGVGEARLFVFDGSLGEWNGDGRGARGKPRPAYRVVRLR